MAMLQEMSSSVQATGSCMWLPESGPGEMWCNGSYLQDVRPRGLTNSSYPLLRRTSLYTLNYGISLDMRLLGKPPQLAAGLSLVSVRVREGVGAGRRIFLVVCFCGRSFFH